MVQPLNLPCSPHTSWMRLNLSTTTAGHWAPAKNARLTTKSEEKCTLRCLIDIDISFVFTPVEQKPFLDWLTHTCRLNVTVCVCASVDGVWEISMIFSPLLTSIFSETEWGCQTNRKICKWSWNVCVGTICTDVKLPSVGFCFCCWLNKIFLPCMQGVVAGSRVYHQRRHSGFPGDTWPDQPCVPAFPIFVNGDRLSQVPACRSKPFQFLHCCRNLVFYFILSSVASEPSSEQGRRKRTSNWISRWINQFLLSDCAGLFVHVWCIPHQ